MAHIWCETSERPLIHLRRADFPAAWGWLRVGSRVDVKPGEGRDAVFAQTMTLLASC